MNRPGPVQPVGCRSVMTTGIGVALVAAGAILRFALPAAFIHGLDLRVAGVIVMLAGVFALLLSLLVWGPLNRRRGHTGDNRGGAAAGPAAERLPKASRPRDQESALAGRPGSARLPRQRPERDRYHIRSAHRVQ